MPRYRKKPVEIEARQLNPENALELTKWCDGTLVQPAGSVLPFVEIVTLEGTMTAQCGNYIIEGVEGEFYPCAPKIFYKTYDLIPEGD